MGICTLTPRPSLKSCISRLGERSSRSERWANSAFLLETKWVPASAPCTNFHASEIGFKLFSLCHHTDKGRYVILDSKTNQPVKSMIQWVCEDTGSLLLPSQVKYCYYYGGERIMFDKEEVEALKTVDRQGLRLMGFKPRSFLKDSYNIMHANFLYPDEQTIKGSTIACAALIDQMISMDKVAIALFTPRANTPPRLVALLPQFEKYDEDQIMTCPAGFHVIPLPYSDDIRTIQLFPAPTATPEQIAKTKRVVKKLHVNFDSRNFENPALQKHYAALQALALDRAALEEVHDYLIPDEDGMLQFSDILQELKASVYPDGYSAECAGQKRKAGTTNDGEPATKKRATIGEFNPHDVDWVSAVTSGKIVKFTVPQLREYLRWQRVVIPSKSHKADLLELVKQRVRDVGNSPPPDSQAPQQPAPSTDRKDKLAAAGGEDVDMPAPSQKPAASADVAPAPAPASQGKLAVASTAEKRLAPEPPAPVDAPSPVAQKRRLFEKQFGLADDDDEDDDGTSASAFVGVASSVTPRGTQSQVSTQSQAPPPSASVGASQSQAAGDAAGDPRPMCKYGASCYRKNEQHLRQFRHPPK
eukprot:TRINITY_DN4385_c0_g1_i2.p1 TRINITY_DN4385_c0_g1~~TRINITY_DN4385_c0_g1_i2.p1  ORF type:complete len:587 (-),score=125.41 TRINITY_DN4385_c0_g1_i2:91-1851(-)